MKQLGMKQIVQMINDNNQHEKPPCWEAKVMVILVMTFGLSVLGEYNPRGKCSTFEIFMPRQDCDTNFDTYTWSWCEDNA